MSDTPEKKNDHPIFVNVVSIVLAGIILLICTSLYNLILAHIWPVTIHFGEYSLNNFIFILVSVASSLLLVVIVLSLEIFYIFNVLGGIFLSFVTPPEKRKQRKTQWFEHILNVFLWAALMMNSTWGRKDTYHKMGKGNSYVNRYRAPGLPVLS